MASARVQTCQLLIVDPFSRRGFQIDVAATHAPNGCLPAMSVCMSVQWGTRWGSSRCSRSTTATQTSCTRRFIFRSCASALAVCCARCRSTPLKRLVIATGHNCFNGRRYEDGNEAENSKLLGDIILVFTFVGSMLTIFWAVRLCHQSVRQPLPAFISFCQPSTAPSMAFDGAFSGAFDGVRRCLHRCLLVLAGAFAGAFDGAFDGVRQRLR